MHDVKEGFKRETERLQERIAGMEGPGTELHGRCCGRGCGTHYACTQGTCQGSGEFGVGGDGSLGHTDGRRPRSQRESHLSPAQRWSLMVGQGLLEAEVMVDWKGSIAVGEGEGEVDEVGRRCKA